MQTIRVLEKTTQDGTLHLSIPLGQPNAAFEVVVVVQPQETLALPETPRRARLAAWLFRKHLWFHYG
jgi:hypothetical protein